MGIHPQPDLLGADLVNRGLRAPWIPPLSRHRAASALDVRFILVYAARMARGSALLFRSLFRKFRNLLLGASDGYRKGTDHDRQP
jgi:hypothetical protein